MMQAKHMVFWLVLGAVGGFVAASTEQEAVEEHLRRIVNQQPLVLAVFYSLPETTAVFTAATEERAWSTYRPSDLPALLTKREREAVITAVAEQLATLPETELEALFERMQNWLLAHEQVSVFTGLTSIEQTMAAVFALPLTRGLFADALMSRQLDPEEVTPSTVSETLAPAEMAAITYDLLRVISSLSQMEQLRYYRDAYEQLLRLVEDNP